MLCVASLQSATRTVKAVRLSRVVLSQGGGLVWPRLQVYVALLLAAASDMQATLRRSLHIVMPQHYACAFLQKAHPSLQKSTESVHPHPPSPPPADFFISAEICRKRIPLCRNLQISLQKWAHFLKIYAESVPLSAEINLQISCINKSAESVPLSAEINLQISCINKSAESVPLSAIHRFLHKVYTFCRFLQKSTDFCRKCAPLCRNLQISCINKSAESVHLSAEIAEI